MSRCSRWPVGDRGPPRPLGPMHSVTLFPPLATPLGVWNGDGLDECEISRPEILSQSAPVHIHILSTHSVLLDTYSYQYTFYIMYTYIHTRVTTRPAFCGTVPKLGALSRVLQDVSCVPHFNYVFCIFFFIPEI